MSRGTIAAYPAITGNRHIFPAFWLVLAVAGLSLAFAAPADAAVEKMSLRYLRGVHVLRTMLPEAGWPPVSVPRQVRNHDTTSALLAHRDRTFVLESVAGDLAAATATGRYPESGYYAARAFSLLGRHNEAADAMKNYIAKAKFRDEDYLFLVRELYAAADYKATLAAARQWQMADDHLDACSEDRLTYIWGSLQAMGRYRDAMEVVLSDPCASWRGQLYFARSGLALGDEESALARLDAVLAMFPEKNQEIHLLWDKLTASERYP